MHESLRGNTVAGSTLEALIFAIMQCLRWPRESESCVSIGDRRRREKMKNEKKWFCPAEGLGRSGLCKTPPNTLQETNADGVNEYLFE